MNIIWSSVNVIERDFEESYADKDIIGTDNDDHVLVSRLFYTERVF